MARTRKQPAAPDDGMRGRDEILYVDPATIEPDPEQPRLHPDDELQASIARDGVLQAITVRPHPATADRWMIVDGERRWRGAVAAKQSEIPIRIRFDLEDRGERLLVQLAANKGKPLTPLEEALAWKAVMDEMGWSQAQFAKETGTPRSTVGDRMRILDLDAAWIELLKAGTIQVSHVPFLHKYIAIPSKHQQEIAAKVTTEFRLTEYYLKKGQPIPVDQLESVIRPYFDKCLRPLPEGTTVSHLRAEWPKNAEPYEGPTLTIKESFGTIRYAADPDIWRPIVRRAQAQRVAKEKKARKEGKTTSQTPSYLRLPPGYKKVKSTDNYNAKPPKGWTEVVDRNGRWNMSRYYGSGQPFDPDVFLEHVDPEKLAVFERGSWSGVGVATNDDAAYGMAREAWLKRWAARRAEIIAQQRAAIGSSRAPTCEVAGAGVRHLLLQLASKEGVVDDLFDAAEVANLTLPALTGGARNALAGWLAKLPDAELLTLGTTYARLIAMQLDTVTATVQHEQTTVLEAYLRRTVRWSAIGRPASQAVAEEISEDDLPDSADEELEEDEDVDDEDPDDDGEEWDDPEDAELEEEAIDA